MKYFVLSIFTVYIFSSSNLAQNNKPILKPVKTKSSEQTEFHEKVIHSKASSTNGMKYFMPQDFYSGNLVTSSSVLAPNNVLLVFWVKNNYSLSSYDIYLSKSSNNGETWFSTDPLQSIPYTNEYSFHITSNVAFSGRIILIYNKHTLNAVGSFYQIYSDNNGLIWSSPQIVLTGFGSTGRNPILSRASDGNLWLTYNRSDVSLRTRFSTNNGQSWSSEKTFTSSIAVFDGSICSLDSGKIGLIYGSSESSLYRINLRSSSDSGTTWTDPQILLSYNKELTCIRTAKNSLAEIFVVFEQEKQTTYNLPNQLVHYTQPYIYSQSDIFFIKSSDNGISWSLLNQFTKYFGYDGKFNMNIITDKPMIFFQSSRKSGQSNLLWYGMAEVTSDDVFRPTVPVLGHVKPVYNSPVIINSLILKKVGIQSAVLSVFVNNQFISQVNLFDDGLHNDGEANDNYWGNVIGPFDPLIEIYYSLHVTDSIGNQITRGGTTFNLADYLTQAYLLDVNKIEIPILNNGVLADVNDLLPQSGARYEEGTFLFSGGFLLSGYSNDTLWANGAMSSSRVEDYLPGPQGEIPNPTNTKLFIVKESDAPFSQSWQDWVHAVNLGADFFDGDGDSIYFPIDFNSNGQWDQGEDRPGLVGDETIFCVYNDRVPANLRRFSSVDPKGVEVRQTVYSFNTPEFSLDHSIFIKYQIVNKGLSDLDSVFFSAFTDADIGQDYGNDLFGSDTTSLSGFTYKNVSDAVYGNNPPAFFLTILQGPVVFIPGETFIDNNANGIYDPGIDLPLDTAFNVRGQYIGIDTIAGAKNLKINSSMHYMSSHPTMGDPNDVFQARFLQLGGYTTYGLSIDPCNWSFGNVFGGVNCSMLNPKFLYSGNPETNYGWINTTMIDQRALLSVGPFQLKKNKSSDLLVSYTVGRGNSGLNSVTVGKTKTHEVIEAYKNNFPVLVNVSDYNNKNNFSFELFQNYPNPFNPSTKIRWQSPVSSWQTLIVYDVLGNEIATLVNEYKPAGSYEVVFENASGGGFASGVYYYQLKCGSFVETKKMLFLK